MTSSRLAGCAMVLVLLPSAALAQRSERSCTASPTSITPADWRDRARAPATSGSTGLHFVSDVRLPGPPNRFDYQSVDPVAGRLYLNHMNAGTLLVIDANDGRVIREVAGLSRATGVLAVPAHHQVYVSAAGRREVAVIDDRTFKVTARIGGMRFPDGIAYATHADKVFVSDEAGRALIVIDPRSGTRRATIELGGEAGNSRYDSVSRCILVTVQTKNEIAAVDPVSERIVQRYALPGSDHPHGFEIDEASRLAFIAAEGNAMLLVLDLRTMRVLQTLRIAADPDVVAWDPSLARLYVAAESGVLSSFSLADQVLRPTGTVRAPHAHTVSVDPRTHRVFLPLQDVNGHPVLRILAP